MNNTYSNTAKGLLLIFWGEIAKVICQYLFVCIYAAQRNTISGLISISDTYSPLFSILIPLCYIVVLIGIAKAAQDNNNYYQAFVAGIVYLVIALVAQFANRELANAAARDFLSVLSNIVYAIYIFLICKTTSHIFEQLKKNVISFKWKRLSTLVIVTACYTIFLFLLSYTPMPSTLFLGIATIIGMILSLVTSILYYVRLYQGFQLLKAQSSEH